MGQKILAFDIGTLGNILQAMIQQNSVKKAQVKYATGEPITGDISIDSVDLAFGNSQIRVKVSSDVFPETDNPEIEHVSLDLTEISSVEVE